jgi:RND family efflux transporter MFP subunit
MQQSADVSTTQAVMGDLPLQVTGFGIVEFDPAGVQTLVAEIEARVTGLVVQPGESVEATTVLLRLQPSSRTDVELDQARRDADLAASTLSRTRRLRDDGLASDADVETAANDAEDKVALAESLERRARALSDVIAPMAGLVDAMLVGPGDLVVPGAPLARMVSRNKVQARIGVEIEDATRLDSGAAVRLSSLDNSQLSVQTEIGTVDYRVDPATRMATVVVPVPADAGLLPGEAVRAEMTIEVRRGVVLAPRLSIFTDENGSFVYVVQKSVANLRRIQVGATGGTLSEVLSGLDAGEQVVVEGAAILSDGMNVRESAPSGAATP